MGKQRELGRLTLKFHAGSCLGLWKGFYYKLLLYQSKVTNAITRFQKEALRLSSGTTLSSYYSRVLKIERYKQSLTAAQAGLGPLPMMSESQVGLGKEAAETQEAKLRLELVALFKMK